MGMFEIPRVPRRSVSVTAGSTNATRTGPCPAYPSGKPWNEATGKAGSEMKFRHNVISGADYATQAPAVTHAALVVWGRNLLSASPRSPTAHELHGKPGQV